MPVHPSLTHSVLATPPTEDGDITPAIRASLLSTVLVDNRPLLLSGIAGVFVAMTAVLRLHERWAILWLVLDVSLLTARLAVVQLYRAKSRPAPLHPGPWAARYVPFALAACLLLGLGAMACVISRDAVLATLAIMVTAGILGGIASRNAALPRLAIAQIFMGAVPIGIGAALAADTAYWILIPPLFLYVGAMVSVVRRHYRALVGLMTAEERHAELAARFDAALAHMPHGLCTIDEAGKVVIANRKAAELFGATVEKLRLNVPLPEFIGYVGLAKFGETLRHELVRRCGEWLREERAPLDLKLADGRQLEMTRNPVPDGSEVVIIEDVTERRKSEAKILHWAHHDSLTGLPNRRYLGDHAKRLLSASASVRGQRVAVMYVDLDGFKHVNDTLGHNAGDEVLKQVADRLRNVMRRGELVARFGGDEFAVVASQTGTSASAVLARRIIQELSAPYRLTSGGRALVCASVGIAIAGAGESFDDVLKHADSALYEAKSAGKGMIRFWEHSRGPQAAPAISASEP
ncbi:sensor domain-containing diguanylate cyclase [Caballeronia telluris]|uniref:Diguanylate cyclase n=1 Tax=Caballeronia telluris TaxID=326475 RepID=A0A158H0Y9_9BURK|nr:sensor domain-containing diguanylate cyclase [Caballeronia telluris]SAL37390.1 diguanylate cyclase [Caballeronia telluris]